MSAASLLTSVPVMPIATPMSARRSAGRVVDAVAGHRDDRAAAPPGVDDPQLLLGVRPRVDRDVGDDRVEGGVVELLELGAGQGPAAVAQDADPSGDRGARSAGGRR